LKENDYTCIFNTEFMPATTFQFKQFYVNHDQCAMKVGTDGVLLGSWVIISREKKILDIGTGTGLIALMMAQRSPATIDAIDIDVDAFQQAKINVSHSPWGSRINVHLCSLQYFSLNPQNKYDLIVSNPPYFLDAAKSVTLARNVARHTDETLSFDDLISGVVQMLAPSGRFCLILPCKEGNVFFQKAFMNGLYCNHITRVKTKKEKTEKRLLMEFSFRQTPIIDDLLIIQKDELHFTEEYIDLTKDYYLALDKGRHKPLD
jgi:tRNA1Val (adenine37-N6)-methyltransferase